MVVICLERITMLEFVGIQFHYIKGHWQILLESVHGTTRASANM